jgi:hypothetical protein
MLTAGGKAKNFGLPKKLDDLPLPYDQTQRERMRRFEPFLSKRAVEAETVFADFEHAGIIARRGFPWLFVGV